MHLQIVLPPKLSRALSNIDTQASRTDRNRPTRGWVDTVWQTVVLKLMAAGFMLISVSRSLGQEILQERQCKLPRVHSQSGEPRSE